MLEKKIDNLFTQRELIDTLSQMNFYNIEGEGYIPIYERTNLTELLHDKFGFRTDYQILKNQSVKKIINITKKVK